MRMSLSSLCLSLAATALLVQMPGMAQASGRLPPVPIPPRLFESFEACRAFLDDTYRQDLAKAQSEPVPVEGGSTRQTLIESKGPIVEDRTHASYDVTEGWQVRHPEPDKGYIEISYAYRRTIMSCYQGVLNGSVEEGYNLPSREPHP